MIKVCQFIKMHLVKISLLLNDHHDALGTTSIIPKSHRFSVGCRESGAEIYLKPSIMKYFTKPLIGSAGDLFLFFKHTWHGRIKGKSNQISDCILMGIFGSRYKYKPFKISSKMVRNVPKKLSELIRSDLGLKSVGEDYFEVTSKEKQID